MKLRTKTFLLLAALFAVLGTGTVLAKEINCAGKNPCQGTQKRDIMRGTSGKDVIIGRRGHDVLIGAFGADRLNGGEGNDRINAEEHYDYVFDFSKPITDVINAGPGNDIIWASDGHPDIINCGPGRDRVEYDPGLDKLRGCEIKTPREFFL